MIASQEKDDAGRILPLTMTRGEVSWFTPGPGRGAGRLMVTDASTGMARNFSCWNQVVICDVDPFDLLQFGLATVSSAVIASPETCLADYGSCDGQLWGAGGSGFSYSWSSLNPSIAPLNTDSTQSSVDFWGAATGNSGFMVTIDDGYGCSAGGGGSDTVTEVTQSPADLKMSSGDVNKSIAVTVSPSGASADVSFNVVLTNNPNSASQATVTIGPQSAVSGTQNIPISVSGTNSPSGIFTATAKVDGSQAPTPTTLTIPPQVLIQVLDGEAGGQSTTTQDAIGSAIKNRFGQSIFPGGTESTYQAVIISSQFDGINTNILTGVEPVLDQAAMLFTGDIADTVQGSACFFSPGSYSDWIAIKNAINTQNLPAVDHDPHCYSTNEQMVVKDSIENNNSNGCNCPAFIFERPRNGGAAVVEIP